MTEKVCQLYEEEKIGKLREGRKAVPSNKMPDLEWDIAETQLQWDSKTEENQEHSEINHQHTSISLQAMITIAVIVTTILEHLKTYIQEIPEITRKTAQVVKSTTTKISRNRFIQNIKKSYKTAALAINIATNTMDSTNCTHLHQTANRNTHNTPGTRKLNGENNKLYQSHLSRASSYIHD